MSQVSEGTRYRLAAEGREFRLRSPFVVGRGPDCQLRLNGGLVSRRHARFVPLEDGLVVEDLESRNGVLVNRRKIQAPTRLFHGDIVSVGVNSLEVIDEHVLHHAPNLSTLPPGHAAPGEADIDGPLPATVVANLDVLSEREREVLKLIVYGHTQKEMSELLHISVKTIESHRANISEKLGCRTRAELVSYAITAGLLRGTREFP